MSGDIADRASRQCNDALCIFVNLADRDGLAKVEDPTSTTLLTVSFFPAGLRLLVMEEV